MEIATETCERVADNRGRKQAKVARRVLYDEAEYTTSKRFGSSSVWIAPDGDDLI